MPLFVLGLFRTPPEGLLSNFETMLIFISFGATLFFICLCMHCQNFLKAQLQSIFRVTNQPGSGRYDLSYSHRGLGKLSIVFSPRFKNMNSETKRIAQDVQAHKHKHIELCNISAT